MQPDTQRELAQTLIGAILMTLAVIAILAAGGAP